MGDALVDKQYDLKNPKVLSFLLTGEGTLDKWIYLWYDDVVDKKGDA